MSSHPSPRTIDALRVDALHLAFRGLERIAALKQTLRGGCASAPSDNPPVPDSHRSGSLWVFASTIGELTLIEPLLNAILAQAPQLALTLISDRSIYGPGFTRRYPAAHVHLSASTLEDTRRLLAATPPMALIIAEIPCLPGDAPCRLPYSSVRMLHRRGVPIALLNGWLYGYQPASRLDRLERKWFAADYLRCISLITVQDETTRARLIGEGARPDSVHVMGNTKFDAFTSAATWSPAGRPSERLLRALQEATRPVVVAGCVTDARDQELVLDAYVAIRATHANALLVIAPRHPENAAVLNGLHKATTTRALRARLRSAIPDAPLATDDQVLVLDTFGELRDFYAVASCAYVGPNHNLLEPLALGKPTTTREGWDTTFPSYPVYAALRGISAIQHCTDPQSLGNAWNTAIATGCRTDADRPRGVSGEQLTELVQRLAGATAQTLPLLRALVLPGHGK